MSVIAALSVSVVCDQVHQVHQVDQVDQVVPAHRVDDIDEAHQGDPVHQVDHKDEFHFSVSFFLSKIYHQKEVKKLTDLGLENDMFQPFSKSPRTFLGV